MLKTERAEKMNRQFAETLKKLRTSKGLSQRELAERMFVNRSTVARWESGSRLPDAVMISRLSRAFDTSKSAKPHCGYIFLANYKYVYCIIA